MTSSTPQLASLGVLVRKDGRVLMVRHPSGPFAGRYSMPIIGVADHETAEDALERLLRDMLHVEPGTYEFLDTLYLNGSGGERFIGNAFTCIDWQGELRYTRELFDDAVWLAPEDPGELALLPEVREFFRTAAQDQTGVFAPAVAASELLAEITEAREGLLAAFDAVPEALRAEILDEAEGLSPLDVLACAADVEAYEVAELRRCLSTPTRVWTPFNLAQWGDLLLRLPPMTEAAVRERLDAVRAETQDWLRLAGTDVIDAYVNRADGSVGRVGGHVAALATGDRARTDQLQRMLQTATVRNAPRHRYP